MLGLAFAALGALIVDAVRPEETGAATGINTILHTVGGAAGAQIAATITPASGLPAEGGFAAAFLVSAGAAVLAAGTIPTAVARPVERVAR